jgi:hypothetical protein
MQFSGGGENPKSKWRLFYDLAIKTVAHGQPCGDTLSQKLKKLSQFGNLFLIKKAIFASFWTQCRLLTIFRKKHKTLMLTTMCSQFSM